MSVTTTYTEARAKLATYWDRVVQDREIVRIRRRGVEDVMLIAASELESLMEAAYLFRSPRNAMRLQAALEEVRAGNGHTLTLDELRREVGLGEEAEGGSASAASP